MPWKWLFYIAKVELNFTEKEFWRLTPRKLLAVWDEHCRFHGLNKEDRKTRDVYIDQVGWL